MKEQEIISKSFALRSKHLAQLCNVKINRQIKAEHLSQTYDLIIVIIDGDGQVNQKKLEMEQHIETNYVQITKIIVIETEIEEWLCESLDIEYNMKPSRVLRSVKNYEKRKLPDLIHLLNYEKLLFQNGSFQEFVETLNEQFS
ncbi:MAG: hypothetical protein ACFE9L_21160 [Candidatus Hodarchaeota archaeon]